MDVSSVPVLQVRHRHTAGCHPGTHPTLPTRQGALEWVSLVLAFVLCKQSSEQLDAGWPEKLKPNRSHQRQDLASRAGSRRQGRDGAPLKLRKPRRCSCPQSTPRAGCQGSCLGRTPPVLPHSSAANLGSAKRCQELCWAARGALQGQVPHAAPVWLRCPAVPSCPGLQGHPEGNSITWRGDPAQPQRALHRKQGKQEKKARLGALLKREANVKL